jgi:hypothetical protein
MYLSYKNFRVLFKIPIDSEEPQNPAESTIIDNRLQSS